MFKKATKHPSKLRMALVGPSGSGKTFTALRIATAMGSRVALIDTEHGTSAAYADLFDFDMMAMDSFHPSLYAQAIREAEQQGYDVVIVDSLSHAWTGRNGALELVDKAAKRNKTHSTATAWRDVTPLHNALVETILRANIHVIVTLRAKTKYVLEQDEKGKAQVKKVGLEAVQREGLEYEFDVVADLDLDNNLVISKARCPDLSRRVFPEAGPEVAEMLTRWLTAGVQGQAASTGPADETSLQGNGRHLSPLGQATRALFDDNDINEIGRKSAFKAIRDEFHIERLEDILPEQYDRYWRFITQTVLPGLKVTEQSAA